MEKSLRLNLLENKEEQSVKELFKLYVYAEKELISKGSKPPSSISFKQKYFQKIGDFIH